MINVARERLLKGFAARGSGQVATIAIRLIEIPLMFHFWGVSLYGEWLLLIAIPTYLSMSDFGFGGVTARHMAMLVAANKRDEALGSFQSSHVLITATSLAIAICLVGSIWLFSVYGEGMASTFPIQLIGSTNAVVIVAFFSVKMIMALQAQLCFAGLQCEGKYPLGLLLIAFSDLIEFVCLAGFVMAGAPPVVVAAAACGGVGISLLIFWIVLRKNVPWIAFGLSKFNMDQIRELWKPSMTAMVFPLGQALSYQGPRIVIGALVGPAAVAIFVAHRQLVRFGTLVLSMGAPLQAELAMMFGRGDQDAYRRYAPRATAILVWLSLAALAFSVLVGVFLFQYWTSGRLAVEYQLMIVLAVATFGEVLWRSVLLPINAINRHMRVAAGYLVVSIFILVPMLYLLSDRYGLVGAAFSLLLAEFSMVSWTVRESMRLQASRLWPWLLETMAPPIGILRDGRAFLAARVKSQEN